MSTASLNSPIIARTIASIAVSEKTILLLTFAVFSLCGYSQTIKVENGKAVEVTPAIAEQKTTLTKSADIVITGVGSAGVIKGSMLKSGAVVIDAGTTLRSIEGKVRLLGDVDFKSAAKRASALTPTPGGVGPLTVAMLFRNAVDACLRMHT